ncbi:peptide-methionine (S)-S-oxide reductase MsrA [Parvularcula sp. LCG005]|uniref:peptide-methionine (S)-S-oxide reductase MsrA n=1 Tax=Parvularcula sp. LCG005 TaxID=3078805 RepID=UPI002943912E|nr:peptide-methionine (S)-S-oxide reductase MsrA [Parvularcula sp. LCG005]WOI54718.1 peptide-methionine (S)-S-oxide reductase MsrA [Parvularcula sp. LCG005]
MRIFILALFALGCSGASNASDAPADPATTGMQDMAMEMSTAPDGVPASAKSLVVAGGCFWCVESDFEHRDDVYEAVSGYAGGEKRDATYKNHDGHREVVEVWYDPEATSYGELVRFFLRTIDVTDAGGQFCDRGHSYTTALHYRTPEEKAEAEAAISEAEDALGRKVVTPVEPLPFFVTAEDYHQDYYKSDDRILSRFGYVEKQDAYKGYREGCGRDKRVRAVWGDAAAIPAH